MKDALIYMTIRILIFMYIKVQLPFDAQWPRFMTEFFAMRKTSRHWYASAVTQQRL